MLAEWQPVRLGQLCEFRAGSAFPTKYQGQAVGGFPFIKVSDMELALNQRQIVQANHWVSDEVRRELRAAVHPPGATVFAKIGVALTFNRRRFLTRPTIIDNNMMSAIPSNSGVNPTYFYYLLCQIDFNDIVLGSALPYVNARDLAQVEVKLPPLPEQRAIAAILGALDDKIELNRRMNENLEAMARDLFKSWFVDFEPFRDQGMEDSPLGPIPRGWRVGRLSNLCSTQYGYTASAVEEPIGPHLLRVTDINKQDWIEWASVPYCKISDEDKPKYALEAGDLVVARMADPGKSAIIEEPVDAVFASYLVRLKTESLAHAYYVYGFLKSQAYTEYSEGAVGGSVQKNMNAKVIVAVDLVIPPRATLEAFLQRVLPLRRRLVANIQQSNTLATLRDALLPKLLSGEIRVKDAEKFVEQPV